MGNAHPDSGGQQGVYTLNIIDVLMSPGQLVKSSLRQLTELRSVNERGSMVEITRN